ncbi:cell wall binding repeat 2 family protein [Clostridioides difficile Y307]|uniref:cell wall-binding repeat-containing protein n=1 Tax=Clostridioides difficile TaxID=1496 RepID=UPI00038D4CEA|nr:cell wall-binding repeat-containing protein [Clostridioides difficile]EQI56987.1 cell wall binding repeat 2 family protein [Clostridioides difficile Y307]
MVDATLFFTPHQDDETLRGGNDRYETSLKLAEKLNNEKDISDIIVTVETIEELDSALKKVDANDIIKFRPDKKISESFNSQSITINMPNGELNNTGDISKTLILKDIKDGTLVFLISKNFPPLFGIYYYVISIPHINQ